ncbi:hypothetical protein FCV25MIE_04586 [Fagus crenata]
MRDLGLKRMKSNVAVAVAVEAMVGRVSLRRDFRVWESGGFGFSGSGSGDDEALMGGDDGGGGGGGDGGVVKKREEMGFESDGRW